MGFISSEGSKDIATMKGSTITVDDFITKLKNKALANSQMVIYKVFEEKYGDKVTDKDIQKTLTKPKNKKNIQETVKTKSCHDAGLKAHLKITDEDLKQLGQVSIQK